MHQGPRSLAGVGAALSVAWMVAAGVVAARFQALAGAQGGGCAHHADHCMEEGVGGVAGKGGAGREAGGGRDTHGEGGG